ncbi:hypothetical protein SUGI_0876330 [Cryptomeria japonica]|nr:hypothetical protein SUGI_0876330 [Cryptomeria japonica]
MDSDRSKLQTSAPRQTLRPLEENLGTVLRIHATLLGDGIGPEISKSAKQVFKAADAPTDWDEQYVGTEIESSTKEKLQGKNQQYLINNHTTHKRGNISTAPLRLLYLSCLPVRRSTQAKRLRNFLQLNVLSKLKSSQVELL